MKALTLLKSIQKRPTFPSQIRYFQPDFVNAKPKRYELPASNDPRPPHSDKIIQLAKKIACLPREERMQIGPTLRERLRHRKMQSTSVEGVNVGSQSGASSKVEKKVEKTACDIKLEKFDASAEFEVIQEGHGSAIIRMIKVIRAITNLGIKEAKEMVEKGPVVIKRRAITKEEANKIIEKFKAAVGGVAVIRAQSRASSKVEEKVEKILFDIKLEKFDVSGKFKVYQVVNVSAKMKLINVVRAIKNLGVKKTIEMEEIVHVVIKQGVTKEEANEFIDKIKAVGGVADFG